MGTVRLSSLNPSASRFTLSLPLLGRPKIPLKQMVTAAQASTSKKGDDDHQAKASNATCVSLFRYFTLRYANSLLAANALNEAPDSAVSNQVSRDQEAALTPSVISPSETLTSPNSASSSWWGYTSWVAGVASSPGVPDAPPQEGINPPTNTIQPLAEAPQSPAKSVSERLLVDSRAMGPGKANTTNPPRPEDDSTSNVQGQSGSASETAQTAGSVWYSPWAWYAGSTTSLPAKFEKITKIPLEGEGTIENRVDK